MLVLPARYTHHKTATALFNVFNMVAAYAHMLGLTKSDKKS